MSVNPRLSVPTSNAIVENTSTYSYLFANKVGSITNGSEKFTFTYDGTLVTSTAQSGVLNHTTNFTYNNDFQVTSSTYAGSTENYSYDNDGLLTSSGTYTLTRDTQNAYTTQVTDGTLTQNRSYNNFGEITQVSDNTFTYELSQRDQSGAIVQKKETLNGITETYDYTFDNMGRLTNVNKDNQEVETYTYDNNGNRQSATVNGTSINASYTLDDNLVVYGDNTYLYDEDGYLQTKTTPDGTTTYSYGTLGELLSVTTPTKSITYQHNANNQRVAKLVNGVVVEKYLWANLTTLLAIYDKDDNLVQRFEYADQRMPIAMTQGSTKYYLHYDQVGSLRAVSRVLSPDNTFEVVKEIVYDTFGNLLSDSNPSFAVPFGFAGGLYDVDTKLTRFGYRDYDAYVGKWTAKDPIGFDGGDSNLYGYVWSDPVNWTDDSGLMPKRGKGKGGKKGGYNPANENGRAVANMFEYMFGKPKNGQVCKVPINNSTPKDIKPFKSEKAAHRAAKRDAGIPTSQTHKSHKKVKSDALDSRRSGTEYDFGAGQKIQNHPNGHTFKDGSVYPKSHYNNHGKNGTGTHYEY